MLKRNLALVLALSLVITMLASCKKDDDYGTVGSADVSTTEEADQGASLFEKLDAPFAEYDYEIFNFESAKFSFEAPKTWRRTIYNQSCIRYDAPADDPHFPGCTFYVKCNYDYYAGESELDPFANMAAEFGKPMSSYITGLPFTVMGRDAWIKSLEVADEYETPSFCKDETAASIKTVKNAIMIDKSTGDAVALGGMDFVAGYFRWENFPVMIATVVPSDASADAKAMVSYMMSSTSYIPQKVTDFSARTYSNITYELPSDFAALDGAGNISLSSPVSGKATSGMSIGVFKVEESLDTMTLDYFQDSYADSVAGLLLDPRCKEYYTVDASMSEDPEGRVLDEKKLFYGTVNILPQDEEYICARMTYGTVGVWYMNCFITEKGGDLYLVADLYPPQDDAAARIVEKAVLQSLKKQS